VSETRKLAAIVAADVVGYSRLMGEDEAGTARAVRERREAATPIVRGLGGRLVKTMGDGVLLEFPSVVAAVECAIAIQRMMAERNAELPEAKRILYRIGVNLGDILIDGEDILGDGVNVAARLEGIADPGGICLSEDAWRQVRDRVKEPFLDLGEITLKNIARPIRVYAQKSGATPPPRAPAVSLSENQGPPRLSLVALPFANIGGDLEQDYFVDGVTESLTTDLSRISGAFVIDRSTAFTYKGKPFDVKQIGRDLNVRYVLEGSVQRGGTRLRVNVQLVEAETGVHLWAERFDKPVADLFDMQDEIVARLANRLGHELEVAEARRAEDAPNPDSMDHYFLGLGYYYKGGAKALGAARAEFDRALELNPDNVDALVRRAWVDLTFAGPWMSKDRVERLRSTEADVTKALRLRPDHAGARCALGAAKMMRSPGQGIVECERALVINPNYAAAHGWIGLAKYIAGREGETEAHVLEALRLSPRDPHANVWCLFVGFAKLAAGLDDEAVTWLNRSIALDPKLPTPHCLLAAALAHLGRTDEARQAAGQGVELNPNFTITRFRAWSFSDHPIYLAGRERIYEGMRLAGVPEE
jgi:TolB-like protein/class 3 adenylate cyclase